MKRPNIVLGFAAMTACICSSFGHASLIEVNLRTDLNDSEAGIVGDPPTSWRSAVVYFPEIHPVNGDTLRIRMDFLDKNNSRQQRVELSDLGIGDSFEWIFGLTDSTPQTGDDFVTANTYTFHNVIGSLLSNPVVQGVSGGGGGVGGFARKDMTDTAFSFTGITWEVTFSQLTYQSGDGFSLARMDAMADRVRIMQAVPEPATLALFGLGLAGLGFSRRKQ